MNQLHKASVAHYEAKRAEAIATLEVYFTKPAGIGEHSELLDEIRKWTDRLSAAHDGLEMLRLYFDADGKPKM